MLSSTGKKRTSTNSPPVLQVNRKSRRISRIRADTPFCCPNWPRARQESQAACISTRNERRANYPCTKAFNKHASFGTGDRISFAQCQPGSDTREYGLEDCCSLSALQPGITNTIELVLCYIPRMVAHIITGHSLLGASKLYQQKNVFNLSQRTSISHI